MCYFSRIEPPRPHTGRLKFITVRGDELKPGVPTRESCSLSRKLVISHGAIISVMVTGKSHEPEFLRLSLPSPSLRIDR